MNPERTSQQPGEDVSSQGRASRDQVNYRGPLKDPTKLPMEEAVRPPPGSQRSDEPANTLSVDECTQANDSDEVQSLSREKSGISPPPRLSTRMRGGFVFGPTPPPPSTSPPDESAN